jgi:hypothetical protein
VLLRQNRSRGARFTSLEDGSMPVFPIERSITIKNYSIRRRQVPMCAALSFSLTDYKTQGQTFFEALLDLAPKGRDSDCEFFYVETGCLTSSERFHLLEKLQFSNINKKTPSGTNCRNGKIASLRKTDFSSVERRYDMT